MEYYNNLKVISTINILPMVVMVLSQYITSLPKAVFQLIIQNPKEVFTTELKNENWKTDEFPILP